MIATDFPHFDAQTIASQGNAVLGIRDSGKSYTAVGLAERLYDAGIPFVAFDPIGRWRFLRVPGLGKGYPIVVAGGSAGDLPLTVESAPQIVRAAMESGVSLVIDLYDMEVSKADWKRIVADSVRVLLYGNGTHGLRHIFIEEAAEFCPQRVGPDQGRVYAEIEKLARMGGNARLGYTLINQRAEEVNKAVLELCDNLFLHRQKGRNSLNALSKWLDVADVKAGKEIVSSLPTLPQGECWAWMAGTDRPVHVKVPAKNSFEPDRRAMGRQDGAAQSKTVDVASFVEALRASLSPPSNEAAKSDRGAKSQIRQAEVDLSTDTEAIRKAAFEQGYREGRAAQDAEAYREGWLEGQKVGIEAGRAALRFASERFGEATGMLEAKAFADEREVSQKSFTSPKASEFPKSPSQDKRIPKSNGKYAEPMQRGGGHLASGADGLLAVVVRHWPAKLTWGQIAALGKRKPRGGHFNASRKSLIDAGMVKEESGSVIPTDAGFKRAGGKPERSANLLAAFLDALPGPANKMLEALLDHPQISAEDLGGKLNMAPRGGHWNSGLAMLDRCGLIDRRGGEISLKLERLN